MLTSLSLPPFNYLIINFITFSLFFLFLYKKLKKNQNHKLYFFYGWLFGFGYFATNLYWISISLTFDRNFEFLIPLTIIIIPSFLAIFYGLVSYLFFIFKSKRVVISILIFSLIFAIIEFVRGSILTGFPWNLLVFSFSNHLEVLSIISIIGTYGFNLLCITLFISPVTLILYDTKKDIFLFVLSILIITSFYTFGLSYKEKFKKAEYIKYNYKIRIISSNISLERFYSETDPTSIIQDLIKISNPNLKEKTIFVWPEGIIPNSFQESFYEFKELFSTNFNENHFLILGISRQQTDNDLVRIFNSLSVYDNELNLLHSYDKINLVPFGEFLPFENFFKIIGFKSLTNNYQSFSSGDKRDIIYFNQKKISLKILPLICYEIIYSGKLFKKKDFDLILNISEDGWFGQSIGPKQHFVHSIFRAIESGKYVVRSANNGISAVVDPLGNIEQSVDYEQSGYIDLVGQKKIQPTIFSRYGNKIFGLLILLYIFLIFSFNKIRNE